MEWYKQEANNFHLRDTSNEYFLYWIEKYVTFIGAQCMNGAQGHLFGCVCCV